MIGKDLGRICRIRLNVVCVMSLKPEVLALNEVERRRNV